MRALVLVDGEHYPPVVRAALDHLPHRLEGAEIVGAVFIGGGEKLSIGLPADLGLGVEVVRVPGDDPDVALAEGLARFRPDLVVDLSDEPVLDARHRLGLAARALAAGVPYVGADFRIDPPPRPHVATKPTLAIVGTGKRTGKTAISAAIARLLVAEGKGATPVVVAMGRGGPPEPELIEPATSDLTSAGLLRLAASGRHAASDHIEGALMAAVTTIGTRRCGGGLVGAPFESTFADGVRLANDRPEPFMILEGSGAAWPPVHADATVCVVPAGIDPELFTGYLGAYRLLLSDLIVVTMTEAAFADLGARAPSEAPLPSLGDLAFLEDDVRRLVPGASVVHTVFRPWPLEPVSGSRVFYVTTAPASARDVLVAHLETEHGATVVGTSHNLARRPELLVDLDAALNAEVLLVELKAAAVDVVAVRAAERGQRVVFCDNRPQSIGGDGSFEDLALATVERARARFQAGIGA